MNTEAFFLPSPEHPAGQRFCIYHPPQGATVRALVVYVHPFAEEMNKSRRMAALPRIPGRYGNIGLRTPAFVLSNR